MGNVFTFFDEFFKTLHPNLYDLGDEETVELNNVELEPEIINITDDCNCTKCYLERKIQELVFGTKDKND
jgi:hypothetical protein